MLEYRPFVPISQGVRVSTAILSYNGRLFFGITGDYSTAPHVQVVASAASAGIEQLRERALARLGNSRRRPRKSRSGTTRPESTG